jgi:hypothetical protein
MAFENFAKNRRTINSPMPLNLEDYIIDIVEAANAAAYGRFSCTAIKTLHAGKAVKTIEDSPGIYFVPGRSRENDAILKVSNEKFPDFAAQDSEKAKLARDVLPVDLAAVIPTPLYEGRYSGRSYVFWPKYRPISEQKILRALQKRRLYDAIYTWLRAIAAASARRNFSVDEVEQLCRHPLRHMADNTKLSRAIRDIAGQALRKLDDKEWRKVGVLQHSDFWLGNVLLPSHLRGRAKKFGFFVIDWGGSLLDGAPGLDLIAFCMSANVSRRRAHKECLAYIDALHLNPRFFLFEIALGLARLGTSLNEFPENRYVDLCESTIDYLRTIGIGPVA